MDPELVRLVGAILGTTGLAGLATFRRRGGRAPEQPTAATEIREAAPGLQALARELASAMERLDGVDQRLEGLEGRVWRCPVTACPIRDQLRREAP